MIGDNFVYQSIACLKTYYSSAYCTLLNSEQNPEWSPSTSLCSVFWVNLQRQPNQAQKPAKQLFPPESCPSEQFLNSFWTC